MHTAQALTRAVLTAAALGTTAALAHGEAHAPKKRDDGATAREEHAFGREGDPRRVSRSVRIDMSDNFRFTPAQVVVRPGETVRFIITNSGQQLHEMVLGTTQEIQAHAALMKKFPNMEHADANMAHVKPGAKGEIVWQFTRAGSDQFACLLPGHYEAGMVGTVVVR